jgi:hypothetical protein
MGNTFTSAHVSRLKHALLPGLSALDVRSHASSICASSDDASACDASERPRALRPLDAPPTAAPPVLLREEMVWAATISEKVLTTELRLRGALGTRKMSTP